jgi:hypothetical protein
MDSNIICIIGILTLGEQVKGAMVQRYNGDSCKFCPTLAEGQGDVNRRYPMEQRRKDLTTAMLGEIYKPHQ